MLNHRETVGGPSVLARRQVPLQVSACTVSLPLTGARVVHLAFHELVDVFHRSPVPLSKLAPDHRAASTRRVLLEPVQPDFFVAPELEAADGPPIGRAFWLVSAPAAVGKSLLAMALAHELGKRGRQVLYVPLRGSVIGQDFFAGLVSSVFPNAPLAHAMESIRATKTVILFDGYDELSMTDEQVELHKLFVTEVKSLLLNEGQPHPSGAPSVVFLYRSAIKNLGILNTILENSHELELQYFSPPKQVEFLAGFLEHNNVPLGRKLAAEFLDAMRAGLQLPDDESVASFLGHAPVLMAIGQLILQAKHPNPQRLAQELLQGQFDPQSWGVALLKRIIEHLLLRESDKFPTEIFSARGLTAVTSAAAYPVVLQAKMLGLLPQARVEGTDWQKLVREAVSDEWSRLVLAVP